MIIYTNAGNPLGLKLWICARVAKLDGVSLEVVDLSGKHNPPNEYCYRNNSD